MKSCQSRTGEGEGKSSSWNKILFQEKLKDPPPSSQLWFLALKNTPSPPIVLNIATPQKFFGKKDAWEQWLFEMVFKTGVACLVLSQFTF